MTHSIGLLKELQKTYASQFNITVMLTDQNGKLLLPAEGENPLSNTLLQQKEENLMDVIIDSLHQEWDIPAAVAFDILPGVQFVVAPVENGKETDCYLWAGAMVEEKSIHLVKEQLKHKYESSIPWEEILGQTPIMTKEKKKKWISRANQLAELASLCIQRENVSSGYSLPSDLLQETTQIAEENLSGLLSRFLVHYPVFDFLGFAEREEEDEYNVTQVAGKGMKPLLGRHFSMGEGFLGRVLLTGKREYWEDIQTDPRSMFFHSSSIYPASLFCEPVKQHDGSQAILFGGNFTRKKISRKETAVGQMLAAVQEVSLSIHSLRMENIQQLSRLTSLVDICRLMSSTPDVKRILFILVDISINLVEGPFSCVIVKEKESEKVKLVSRGETKGMMREYAKDVVNRYYSPSVPAFSGAEEPQLFQTNQGESVMECPLLHGNELLGVLCVGTPELSDAQMAEHLAFLHTLAIIGGVSLQLTNRGEMGLEEDKIEILHQAIEQFEPDAFAVCEEAAMLSAEFAREIGLQPSVAKEITHACQLAFYTYDFVKSSFPDTGISVILEQGKELIEAGRMKDATEVDVASRVFALIYKYVKQEYDLDAIASLEKPGGETYQAFVSYIKGKQVAEQEIMISDPALENQEIKSVAATIKKQIKLSPREQEVLELVMKGLNNREIAKTLFISDHTVKNHVTKIFQKLGVSDRAHAISKVYQQMYE